ncbi:hypothetical protein [Pseudoalteromonas umbrosa]|uniref:hypothetical protein n=1 Tax=Pseudoalteromonas umbrosa TaxID=3048489 RepID=UPI0024C3702F|nr:hypothetical protein [Pseudoalteromonas sp. B95]MDK1288769.1 hypothetical protein [Pseudoalteromonas sp. B95]
MIRFYFILLIVVFSLPSVAASKVGRLFFVSQGQEVEIRKTGIRTNVDSLTFYRQCLYNENCTFSANDREKIVEDFVIAVMYNRLYTYKIEQYDPCKELNCTPHSIDPDILNDDNNSEEYIDPEGISRRESPASTQSRSTDTVVDAALAQVGSSSVLAVRDQLLKNSKQKRLSIHTFFFEKQDFQHKPLMMCTLEQGGQCQVNRNVTVTNFNDGSIGIDYPYDGSPGAARLSLSISEAMSEWDYECTIASTGTFPNMTMQRVCFYRP